MQKQRATKTIVAGCLLVGVLAGAAGAQIAEAMFSVRYIHAPLFSVNAYQEAAFHVTLHDRPSGLPARVALQLFDAAGNAVAREDVVLRGGQSATMRVPGPGPFSARAQIVDSNLDLTGRRQVVGSVEVIDTLTGIIRPTCGFDPVGQPPGR
jgi:hypothetical protein